jgi:single-stranded DNA-binding protein
VNQIGRVGKIKEVGQHLLVSVASDASYKKDGEWQDRTNWVEHTIFARQEGMLKWASEKLQPGDLVHVRSTPSQESWEQDGEKRYGYGFAANELTLLAAKTEKEAEPAKSSPANKKESLIGSRRGHAARPPSARCLRGLFRNFAKVSGSCDERR